MRLGSLGGLIGASVNEFSTDGSLSQNSDNKVPTQAAVKTYVDAQTSGLNGVSGNFTIGGDLTVNGTTTTVNSTNLVIEDKNIVLASGAADDATASGGGITIESGNGNKTFTWNDGTLDTWSLSGGRFQSPAGLDLGGMLKEDVYITTDKMSVESNVNLENGQISYRTTAETTTHVPNIRYSSSITLDSVMNTGEVMLSLIHIDAADE